MTAARRARVGYGPVQLAVVLGLERWQFDRARQGGLIGSPDQARDGGRPRSRPRAGPGRADPGRRPGRCRTWARSAPRGCCRSGSAWR